jgi:hypothetical protein
MHQPEQRFMASPTKPFHILTDFIFILLGGLLLVMALRKQVAPPSHMVAWIALGAALVIWGARSCAWPRRGISRWDARLNGISLAVSGALMLIIAASATRYFPALLAVIGIVLTIRGLAGAAFPGPRRRAS